MTTSKLKPIVLRPHEARRLAECGEVLVARRVEPQPEMRMCDGYDKPMPFIPFDESGKLRCPFGRVGERRIVAAEIPSSPSDNYIAGSNGQIYSQTKRSGRGPNKIVEWYPMAGCKTQAGYLCVSICHEGKKKTRLIHPMICEAFYGPRPFPKAQVRHLDGNPINNEPSNLCWGTQEENWRDRKAHGRGGGGEAHPDSKFSNFERDAIKWAISKDICSRKYAAKVLGVSSSTINAICLKQEPEAEISVPDGRIHCMEVEAASVACRQPTAEDKATIAGVEDGVWYWLALWRVEG